MASGTKCRAGGSLDTARLRKGLGGEPDVWWWSIARWFADGTGTLALDELRFPSESRHGSRKGRGPQRQDPTLRALETFFHGLTPGPVLIEWLRRRARQGARGHSHPAFLGWRPAFSNSRMILKQVWVGKGTEVGSELLSRGFRCGDGEGGGGLRGRGKLCRVVLRARKLVELPPPPPIPEESRADRPVSGRCLTTVTGSPPAVFSCVAASAARTRCRSSGVLVAREKRP